jgi:hypothetical protein
MEKGAFEKELQEYTRKSVEELKKAYSERAIEP